MHRILVIACLVIFAVTGHGYAQTTSGLRMIDRWLPETVSRERQPTAPLDMVMLHFCSDVVENPTDPFNVDRIVEIFTSYTVSAHYLIDRDGTVFRFVPEDRVAYHAGRGRLAGFPERTNRLNEYSIGIEMLNVGSAKDMELFMSREKYAEFAAINPQWIGYTEAQYTALRQLLESIAQRHPGVKLDRKHIIGHEEYAARRRSDPGELFDWKRIGLEP